MNGHVADYPRFLYIPTHFNLHKCPWLPVVISHWRNSCLFHAIVMHDLSKCAARYHSWFPPPLKTYFNWYCFLLLSWFFSRGRTSILKVGYCTMEHNFKYCPICCTILSLEFEVWSWSELTRESWKWGF